MEQVSCWHQNIGAALNRAPNRPFISEESAGSPGIYIPGIYAVANVENPGVREACSGFAIPFWEVVRG